MTRARLLEDELYPPLIDGARIDGWALFRLADGSWGKKPFDIAGIASDGRAVGLEVKVVEKFPVAPEKFPWAVFSEHQKNWLAEYDRLGGLGLIALYNWRLGEVQIYKYGLPEMPGVKLARRGKIGYVGWNLLLKAKEVPASAP